jgi:hypothetical protein
VEILGGAVLWLFVQYNPSLGAVVMSARYVHQTVSIVFQFWHEALETLASFGWILKYGNCFVEDLDTFPILSGNIICDFPQLAWAVAVVVYITR